MSEECEAGSIALWRSLVDAELRASGQTLPTEKEAARWYATGLMPHRAAVGLIEERQTGVELPS
jgi:hypothetical protein